MVTHDAILRGGLRAGSRSTRRPTVLEMEAQDFIPRLLADLKKSGGANLTLAAGQDKTGTMQLYQPIHRRFHPVMVEACCSQPGEPRLDPERILAAGVVVRRVGADGRPEGWMKSGQGVVLGWRPVGWGLKGGPGDDPDAAIRKKWRLGANGALLSRLEATKPLKPADDWREDWGALFTAPPDTCRRFGKTFLYGLVPLTSSERPEADPSEENSQVLAGGQAPFDRNAIRQSMPALLQPQDELHAKLPARIQRGQSVNRTDAARRAFLDLLEFCSLRLGLFGPAPETAGLRKCMTRTTVQVNQYQGGGTTKKIDFYTFLKEAAAVLVDGSSGSQTSVELPTAWPQVVAAQDGSKKSKDMRGSWKRDYKGKLYEDELLTEVAGVLTGRWQRMGRVAGRFEDSAVSYVLTCFIRVAGKPGCPPKTIWTEPSNRFTIAPWYASVDTPPVQVELPPIDPDKPQNLAQLKPNVAFKISPELQQIMEKVNLDDLMEGKREKGSLGLGMICGFNIPIITICAFIVLQIFLSLLHIVFWWLPFVRICIPFPKPPNSGKWP